MLTRSEAGVTGKGDCLDREGQRLTSLRSARGQEAEGKGMEVGGLLIYSLFYSAQRLGKRQPGNPTT